MAIPTIIFEFTKYHYRDKRYGNSYHIVYIKNNKTGKSLYYQLSGDNLNCLQLCLFGDYENIKQFSYTTEIDISYRDYTRMCKTAKYGGCTGDNQVAFLSKEVVIPNDIPSSEKRYDCFGHESFTKYWQDYINSNVASVEK